ncbi:type III pantothenate kinase [Thiomicrospira microaerophila]|uniref:type III pantothenate kinase n=1 Tax=Thiomicrospira microaerophila TaxID=406020 RepID=UPI0006978790|nr:type III pantothenate kinase [Thiomicrospira microaerophila]
MALYIDIGNTRLKWACSDAFFLNTVYAMEYKGVKLEKLVEALTCNSQVCDKVFIASVSDSDFVSGLCRALKNRCSCEVVMLQTVKNFLGLTVCYDEAELLGVDRWLAMLAAYALYKRPTIVVDLGSAITLDCIDANGQHKGGVILPGISAMLTSLSNCKRLADLDILSIPLQSELLLACNTESAILNGVLSMVTQFLDAQVDLQLSRLEEPYVLVLTGGDAHLVKPYLKSEWLVNEYLVLHGIDLVANNENLLKLDI